MSRPQSERSLGEDIHPPRHKRGSLESAFGETEPWKLSRAMGRACRLRTSRHSYIDMMSSSKRIGALDIADAIADRIGSYVDMNFMQFLAVDENRISLWYMNSGGKGPTFDIQLTRTGAEWNLSLTELPPGTEQEIEVP